MPRGSLVRLIATFVLAVACFCGSTLYSTWISRRIDQRATSIAVDVMPSIERLADTRSLLSTLAFAFATYQATGTDADRDAALQARDAVEEAFARHIGQPPSHPGEQAQWANMQRALGDATHALDTALAQNDRTGTSAAAVYRSVAAAAESIRTTIDLDAVHARQLAMEIEQRRRRASRIALLLDLVSTGFTLLAAWMTVRALSQHHRVVEERNQLVARRAEELEQFASRVAHDIVGPLSVTRLAIESTMARLEEPARRSLERGQRGVERVNRIVDGLLRFARAGARPEPGVITPVEPVVRSVVTGLESVAHEASVHLTLAPVPPCSVVGHAGVVEIVLENFTRNAIKYMGERAERRVDVRVSIRKRFVRLEVEDTGPGVAPALLETLFEPYVRGSHATKPGLGLGLATVKRIADAYGGSCGVRSEVDEGSLFWCELPCADDVGPAGYQDRDQRHKEGLKQPT